MASSRLLRGALKTQLFCKLDDGKNGKSVWWTPFDKWRTIKTMSQCPARYDSCDVGHAATAGNSFHSATKKLNEFVFKLSMKLLNGSDRYWRDNVNDGKFKQFINLIKNKFQTECCRSLLFGHFFIRPFKNKCYIQYIQSYIFNFICFQLMTYRLQEFVFFFI